MEAGRTTASAPDINGVAMDGEIGGAVPSRKNRDYFRERRARFALTRARLEDLDSRWSHLEALAWLMYREASAAGAFVALYQHDDIPPDNVVTTAALVAVALLRVDENGKTARFGGYLGEGFGPDLSSVVIDCTFPERLLQISLREGSVKAFGKPYGALVQVIDKGEWLAMEATKEGWKSRKVDWEDVTFCAASMRRTFPPIDSESDAGDEHGGTSPRPIKPLAADECTDDIADSALLAADWPNVPSLYSWDCAKTNIATGAICHALAAQRDIFFMGADRLEGLLGERNIKASASQIRTLRKKMIPELANMLRQQKQQKQQ